MEKIITQVGKKQLILSDEDCDFIHITIDNGDRHRNTKRENKINLSRRQAEKLIAALQHELLVDAVKK